MKSSLVSSAPFDFKESSSIHLVRTLVGSHSEKEAEKKGGGVDVDVDASLCAFSKVVVRVFGAHSKDTAENDYKRGALAVVVLYYNIAL